jgi:hypothetical protein
MGVARVPAIYAVVAAGVVMLTRAAVPLAIMRPIGMLSDAALPIMLLVMGMQLERAVKPTHPTAVAVAVALSLAVGPIVGVGLSSLLGLSGPGGDLAGLNAGRCGHDGAGPRIRSGSELRHEHRLRVDDAEPVFARADHRVSSEVVESAIGPQP